MTDQDRTHLAVVLDRSGSMDCVRDATIHAYNEFIEDQRNQPGRCDVSLTLFNTRFNNVHVNTPIAEVPKLTQQTYVPMGMTALHDAVGSTIDKVGERLAALPEHERPGKVIFAIITDGYENSSVEYRSKPPDTGARVKEMIRRQSEDYSWVFTYLGANQDAWANPLGVPRGNTISYDNTPAGVSAAVATASAGTSAYRASAGGQSATMYSPDPTKGVDQRKKKKAAESGDRQDGEVQ